MRWLLANRTLAALYSPGLRTCRLQLRSRTTMTMLPTITTTRSLHSSASHHTAQKQKQKQKQDNKKDRTKYLTDRFLFDNGHTANRKPLKKAKSTQKNQAPTRRDVAPPPVYEFSEEMLLKRFTIPTRKQLPRMPGRALKQPDSVCARFFQDLGATFEITEVKLGDSSPDGLQKRAQCVAQIPGFGKLVATGDGTKQAAARSAAFFHALAQMYDAGLLHAVWGPSAVVTSQEMKREKHSIIDVYNYAARYGCIPQVSIQRHGTIHLINIEMPEHDIKVIARGGAMELAYVLGVREFKKQAESYELGKGTGSLAVENEAALSVANAGDFFNFCRDSGENLSHLQVQLQGRSDGKHGFVGTLMTGDYAYGPQTPPLTSRENATKLAYLIGAVSLVQKKPQLFEEFSQVVSTSHGQYLGKLPPVETAVSDTSLQEMSELVRFAQRYGTTGDESTSRQDDKPVERTRRMLPLPESQLAARSAELVAKLKAYQNRTDLAELRQTRAQLPMSQFAPQVLDIVQNNTYCVIIGATGSGKTTQVPQILLEDAIANGNGAACNVICTQPRRIAATSVAKRVAEERAERLQDTVGYQVRFDAKLPQRGGSILYCTTGILLQQLQHAPDEVYERVSHLVIDEVHERDMPIDFLLIMLKMTMAARAAQGKKVPHVVLMSATIDAERFADYFKDSLAPGKANDCPTLSVPGRTFPVTERYLGNVLQELRNTYSRSQLQLLDQDRSTADYLKAEQAGLGSSLVDEPSRQESVINWKSNTGDVLADNKDDALVPLGLAATTVAHIAKTSENGAILVFLPGLDEITKLDQMLRDSSPLGVDFNDEQRFKIFMLHSSIQDSQKTVFDALPHGCRKVILSTNIAETSVTIPDVQFVVDTGKSREKRYDQMRRITQLQCTWISKSNAKQRAGRAGRVQNGNYYALFTRSRHESMRAIGLPELLRSDLQEICLDVKSQAFKMPVRDFLAQAIEPPSPPAVDAAMRNLTALEALTREEELTPLGRLLASLPVHPSLGKMIVLGIIFRCLDPMVVLGAAAHERPLFVNPPDKKMEVEQSKRKFAGGSTSDHIMLLNAFRAAREAKARYSFRSGDVLSRDFIHHGAFQSINSTVNEIEGILYAAGLIRPLDRESTLQCGGSMLNENSECEELIKALLVAGLHPNIAVQRSDGRMWRTSAEKATFIHMASVNSAYSNKGREDPKLLAFTTLSLSTDGHRKNLRETTLVNPLTALLFGGRITSHRGPVLDVDGWMRFFVKPKQRGTDIRCATAVQKFHVTIRAVLSDALSDLARKEPLADDYLREKLANGLARIFTREAGGVVPSGIRAYKSSPLSVAQTTGELLRHCQEPRVREPPKRPDKFEFPWGSRQSYEPDYLRGPPKRSNELDYLRGIQSRLRSPNYTLRPQDGFERRW